MNRDPNVDMDIIKAYRTTKNSFISPYPEQKLMGNPVVDVLEHWIKRYLDEKERADHLQEALERAKQPGEGTEYIFLATIHVYNGMRTIAHKEQMTIVSESEEKAEKELEDQIKARYKMLNHLALSSVQLKLIETAL